MYMYIICSCKLSPSPLFPPPLTSLSPPIQGVSYDHVELNFFLNGKSLQCPMMGIRGTIYPVFYGEYWLAQPCLTTVYVQV